jgi:release factor glutamine methyltransferase
MCPVYSPGEDSYLLLKHAKPILKGRVLDMGTGSGILAIEAAQHPDVSIVVAVDIDIKAIKHTRKRAEIGGIHLDLRHGDLFEPIKNEFFDIILFNPPYLPSEGAPDEPIWAGGNKGSEIINRFLEEASKHLFKTGIILMIYSNLSNFELDKWDTSYRIEVLEELPLFYERLICVLLRPR